jgi:hypothetical protein
MKLLIEPIDMNNIQIVKEDMGTEGEKVKNYFLKGPMIGAEYKNKNGRVYPKSIIEREVIKFQKMIDENDAVGTLDHGNNPTIDMDRISHKIVSLTMEGNQAFGVAKVIDSPCGRILKTLIDEEIKIGMSTRGVGSLDEESNVKEDFMLISIDAVKTPSYDKAIVQGVMENKEYIIQGDKIVEMAVQNLQKKVNKRFSGKELSTHTNRYLMEFLNDLKKKII